MPLDLSLKKKISLNKFAFQRSKMSERKVHVYIDLEGKLHYVGQLELAFSVASEFGLKSDQAKKIAKEVGTAISEWKSVAKKFQVSASEIALLSTAFEHQGLKHSIMG